MRWKSISPLATFRLRGRAAARDPRSGRDMVMTRKPERRSGLFTRPEDRAADPHMGRAELDRGFEIGAHAHRERVEPIASGNLGEEREMRRGRLLGGRDAHQALDRKPVLL